MTLNLTIPQQLHADFRPRICVIGVGGGGTNAVDNMIASNLQGVDFIVANTDAQQLMHSRADRRIQLGPHITQGLGAGAKPEIGRAAAEEAADEIARHLEGVHMLFITAGMGGGTGTGAAPVIARMARERNILTVGVVTKPFAFEGMRRARAAEQGIEELQQHVDTLIVIPNQNLFRLANERTSFREAFKMADHVLYMGVRGVTDLIVMPGLVNLDFADIRTVMVEMGKAMMGTGEAEGENRAIRAAEAAINNPLLEETNMAGARGLLINITGGEDMTLYEVDQAANRVREEVDEDANIIFGSAIDEELNGRIRVSVVATGIDTPKAERARLVAVGGLPVAEEQAPAAPAEAAPGAQAEAGPEPEEMPRRHPGAGLRPAPLAEPALSTPQGMRAASEEVIARPVQRPVPLRAQASPQAAEAAAPAPARGLFATPGSRPASAPVPPPAPTGRSLFGTVTGVLRRNLGGMRAPAAEPAPEPRPVAAAEPPRPARPVAEEDPNLDIPAFLRRRSS
jgi:cell division protein FtsZ